MIIKALAVVQELNEAKESEKKTEETTEYISLILEK